MTVITNTPAVTPSQAPAPTAFLARIRPNPHCREVQRDLRYAAEMHKTLMRMVPDHLGEAARRQTGLLYRVDETEHATVLLVQSSTPLAPERLPPRYGTAEIKSLAPMLTALRTGLAVRYRVTVSPVKRERLPLDRKGERGRLLLLTGPDADQWWARKAAEAGLQLHTAVPTPAAPAISRPGDPRPVRHPLVRYDGTAAVTDPEALTRALLTGIGRGKSYGAGLLTLAPAA
jgi:CRISPR system Cascade subunit CasE